MKDDLAAKPSGSDMLLDPTGLLSSLWPVIKYARRRNAKQFLDKLKAAMSDREAALRRAAESGDDHEIIAAAWNAGLCTGVAIAQFVSDLQRHILGRMTRGKGGGKKAGAGRHVGSTDGEVLGAFKLTNHNHTKDARCRAAIVGGKLVTAQGKPMSVAAVKKRLQRGTNR